MHFDLSLLMLIQIPAMSDSPKSFLILFGSVTGKAESIAELIYRDAEARGFEARLFSMSEQDQVSLTGWNYAAHGN